MSCDNVITVQDLETDKKHSTFYREVITGKAGGTGADIDSATNAVTGQTQATLPKVLSNVGFSPAGFDFTTGGTLTERDKAIFYQADGNWYSWGGTLPKVVPPASSPASTGGIADNAWNVSTSAFMYRDWEGFTAELLAQAGIVDDGQPDELGASQRVDAIKKINPVASYANPKLFPAVGDDESSSVVSAMQSGMTTILDRMYHTSTPVRVPNRKTLQGQGELTGIKWTGGNSSSSILEVKSSDPSTTALANVTVKDISISVNNAEDVKAVDMRYASVQSELNGIRVSDLGTNAIGFYIGKEWYARLTRCSVRTGDRKGTGVKLDTSVGQVNAVPLDVQINGADIGFDIDTSNAYIYGLDIPRTAHAENCRIGLKMRSGQGVRQGVISGYFENNGLDVEWGDAGSPASDRTQSIIWLGASFNPIGSRVVLYEGRHYFYGCDRIDTLEVHENASVEILGGTVNNITNTTGDSNRVRYRPSPTTVLSTSRYGNGALLSGREMNYETITSANTAIFDLVPTVFGTKPTNGRACRITACSRRTYENTVRFFECIASQNAAGAWGLTTTVGSSESSSSISIDSVSGVITIRDTRSDSKIYLLSVRPF